MLDNFVFRSKNQTISLCKELFIKHIPKILNKNEYIFQDGRDLLKYLGKYQDKIRLVEVIGLEDRPIKSSPILLRDLRKKFNILPSAIITPSQIKEEKDAGVRCFIFIDDILATGNQFEGFYKKLGLTSLLSDCLSIYAPTVSHIKGIENLTRCISEVHIVSSEILQSNSDVFTHAFNDNENNEVKARAFYRDLMIKYKFGISKEIEFGYGNLALAYAFSDSIPDNALHLFWLNKSNWKPLLNR